MTLFMYNTRVVTEYKEYDTEYGDTFDSMAFQFYTDEQLSSEIIKANPDYADVLIFLDTVTLKIPIFDQTTLPDTLPPWRR